MRKLFLIITLVLSQQFFAQELDCTISINHKSIKGTNTQVFKTLETSVNELMNKTRWTNRTVAKEERIACSIIITLSEGSDVSSGNYKGTIEVQSSRPVFNSTYETPVFSFKEGGFEFPYIEYDVLEYDKTEFSSNLISTLAFYAYTIIGLDSDTFALNGGAEYFQKAMDIAAQAQSQGVKGWSLEDAKSKYNLVDELTSNTYSAFHDVLYSYHRIALDGFAANAKNGKTALKESLMQLKKIYDIRSNSLLLKVFFDTKTDEIVDFFSAGPKVPSKELKLLLIKLSPYNAMKFQKIRY